MPANRARVVSSSLPLKHGTTEPAPFESESTVHPGRLTDDPATSDSNPSSARTNRTRGSAVPGGKHSTERCFAPASARSG